MIGYRIKLNGIEYKWIVESVELSEEGFPNNFYWFNTESEAWKKIKEKYIQDIKALDKAIKHTIENLEEVEGTIKSLESS